jgi:Zn-dependent protease with chaperone function
MNAPSPPAPPVGAYCTSCGTRSEPGARFCQGCGADSQANPSQAAPEDAAYMPGYHCTSCGGDGAKLPVNEVMCRECRWLRPLGEGYALPVESFLWRLDAEAMMRLQSLGPVTAAAHHISERFGRPWFEASVNGVRLSENQLPDVFALAVRQARVVGLDRMPEIYVSGEQMWDAKTLGTNNYAFVVLGSVLTSFKGDDLAFMLAREMGRVRAGHAVWRTAFELLMGRRQSQRTIMGDGVMQFLNPAKIVESAFEAPLMAWARHSEITADRAGQIATGNLALARRVLLQWNLKSFPIHARLNMEDWAHQEDESDDATMQAVEATMSSTPFIARRLKLARDFDGGEDMKAWRAVIDHYDAEDKRLRPPKEVKASGGDKKGKADSGDTVRLVCVSCNGPMRVKRAQLAGDKPVNVRCPNPACGKVLAVKPKKPAEPRPDQVGD